MNQIKIVTVLTQQSISKAEGVIIDVCSLAKMSSITSLCSYARPTQPGPIRTRLCRPCIAAIARDWVHFGPIR